MTETDRPITRELVRVLLVSDPLADGALGPGLRVAVEGPSADEAGLLRALCWGLLECTGTDHAGLVRARGLVTHTAQALIEIKGELPARPCLRLVPPLPADGETGGTPGA